MGHLPFPLAEFCREPPGSREGKRLTQCPLLVYAAVQPCATTSTGRKRKENPRQFTNLKRFCVQICDLCDCVVTLEATMRDLFPTGQTTISQSESRSEGTSTSHSDSISWKHKELNFIECAVAATFILNTIAPSNIFHPAPLWTEED